MIQYLLTSPQPAIEGTDAVYQEIKAIQQKVGGVQTNLFPLPRPNSIFPRFLYGWHQWNQLKNREKSTQINHLYAPTLYHFPILKQLRNPLIYTIIASLKDRKLPAQAHALQQFAQIIVSNRRDQAILNDWGFQNHSIIRPGITTAHFQAHRLPVRQQFKVLMASAPWELAQFDTKGVDLLLRALQQRPFLHLTFLWRGFLYKEMLTKIKDYQVESQVQLINKKAVVADVLKTVHTTVLIAKTPELVKAYPHSLLESILSGKPVIIGNEIPMADDVEERQCGVVVEDFNLVSLLKQMDALHKNYEYYAQACRTLDRAEFSAQRMVVQYMDIYDKINSLNRP